MEEFRKRCKCEPLNYRQVNLHASWYNTSETTLLHLLTPRLQGCVIRGRLCALESGFANDSSVSLAIILAIRSRRRRRHGVSGTLNIHNMASQQ